MSAAFGPLSVSRSSSTQKPERRPVLLTGIRSLHTQGQSCPLSLTATSPFLCFLGARQNRTTGTSPRTPFASLLPGLCLRQTLSLEWLPLPSPAPPKSWQFFKDQLRDPFQQKLQIYEKDALGEGQGDGAWRKRTLALCTISLSFIHPSISFKGQGVTKCKV